jgi:hypothetical protein
MRGLALLGVARVHGGYAAEGVKLMRVAEALPPLSLESDEVALLEAALAQAGQLLGETGLGGEGREAEPAGLAEAVEQALRSYDAATDVGDCVVFQCLRRAESRSH